MTDRFINKDYIVLGANAAQIVPDTDEESNASNEDNSCSSDESIHSTLTQASEDISTLNRRLQEELHGHPGDPARKSNGKRKSIEVLKDQRDSSKKKKKDKNDKRTNNKKKNGEKSRRAGNSSDSSDEGDIWQFFLELWPVESRTPYFRSKAVLNSMTREQVFKVMDIHKDQSKLKKEKNHNGAKADEKIPCTKYPEEKDDRRTRFHKASMLRLPVVEPEKWFEYVPTEREQIFKSIPLKASGSEHCLSDVTIEKLHDRTSNLDLKFFMSENISVSAKPMKKTERFDEDGLATITELNWENASNISQATEAIISYGAALQQLWPQDHTAWALLRLFNKYKWLVHIQPGKTRVMLVAAIFNRIMKKNALQAANKDAPIDYDEMERLLKTILTRNNQRCEVPVSGSKPEFQSQSYGKQEARFSNQSQQRLPPLPALNGLKPCYGFNDPNKPCANVPLPGGQACKNTRGLTFAHCCTNFLQSKGAYCMQAHSKKSCPNK